MDQAVDSRFVHPIDPVIVTLGEVELYYYGFAYTLGFLCTHLWFLLRRTRLKWSVEEVCDFTVLLMTCVRIFGRAFAIIIYEWRYYDAHPARSSATGVVAWRHTGSCWVAS